MDPTKSTDATTVVQQPRSFVISTSNHASIVHRPGELRQETSPMVNSRNPPGSWRTLVCPRDSHGLLAHVAACSIARHKMDWMLRLLLMIGTKTSTRVLTALTVTAATDVHILSMYSAGSQAHQGLLSPSQRHRNGSLQGIQESII